MTIYYSKSKNGFYDSHIHGELRMPEGLISVDAREISEEVHAELLAGLSLGQVIECDCDGVPFLTDPPPPSFELLVEVERRWRDEQLLGSDASVMRHRDELESEVETTLSAVEYADLQTYRGKLRAWPAAPEFPSSDQRPALAGLQHADSVVPQPDRRGDVYRTDTGSRQVWTELGDLPDGLTAEPRPGDYYVWEGAWVLDEHARLADVSKALTTRDALLQEAVLRIAPLQYAEDIGNASHDEQLALLEWKRYSVELNRVEQQARFPTEVVWPVVPGTVAA